MPAKKTERFDRARRAAVAALVRVHKGGWANLAAGALADPSLGERDRAFAGAVFFGACERLVTIDRLLAPMLRSFPKDPEVRAILECGAYQLWYMRVPQSAAVNESVKLARAFGKGSAAGLVNAVLRRAAAWPVTQAEGGAPAGPELSGVAFADEAERVQIAWSVSRAVAEAVMEALPGEYDAFFAASFSNGDTCLRANTFKNTPAQLAAALAGAGNTAAEGPVPGAVTARLPGGPANEPLFCEGRYHVQGAASQLACAALGAAAGMRVLDMCAAPGGKTATLAQLMGGGAGLTACELRENRLPLIGQALGRLGIGGVQVLRRDGTVYDPALAGQHRVLCDVPCSGLGQLAQKPDLRLADGANFAALPDLQLKLLATAARYLVEGGRLVYSTCTLRRQENEAVVEAFLAQGGGFEVVPPENPPKGALLRGGMMTLLPHRTGLDGFFVATLAKI